MYAVPLQTLQREENQFLIAWRQVKSKLKSEHGKICIILLDVVSSPHFRCGTAQ